MKMADWNTVENKMPEPHDGVWRVFREGVGFFDATVCYGMHNPWWMPRNGFTHDESGPVEMELADMWARQLPARAE